MAENFIKITYKRKEIYKTILLLFQHPPGGEYTVTEKNVETHKLKKVETPKLGVSTAENDNMIFIVSDHVVAFLPSNVLRSSQE